MKILKLQAENIKKLVAIEIAPEENMIVLTGANGAGKSSVLDSIFWALAGASHIQDKPIRDGEEKAFIKLDLGKITVERRFTEKGTYLDVRTEEGAKFTNAQQVLDDLIGAITFDPLEFSRMKPSEQTEVLLNIVNLDIDLDELAKSYKADFEERTFVNRDVKQLEAQIASIILPEIIPEKEIDVSEKSQDLLALREKNRLVEIKKLNVEAAEGRLLSYKEQLEELKLRVVEEEEVCKALDEDYKISLANQPKPEDISAIEQEIAGAAQKNKDFAIAALHAEKGKHLFDKQQEAEALTRKLDGYKKKKADAFAAAKWPIDGLSIIEGIVHYNNIPFDQASSAEQLRISASIAMSMNTKLKVMRIKDGSLLDPQGFEMLKEMANKNDWQIWVESVYTNDPMAIIIEDGTVKANVEKQDDGTLFDTENAI